MNILKKGAVFLLSLFIITSTYPLPTQAGDLILGGQNHEYKVIFRNDGRAIVFGKLFVPNTNNESLQTIEISLPQADAEQITAYQISVTQECVASTVVNEIATCTKYKDVSSRDITNASYKKITVNDSGKETYALHLPTATPPGMTAVILFAYSSSEYTQEFLGRTTYTFATPTVHERIEKVSVTVQTDSDLFLKGGQTTVAYNSHLSTPSFEDSSALTADSVNAIMSKNSGKIIRESATNLFPGESYVVTGSYSEYWWRVSFGNGGLILLSVAMVIISGMLWKNRGKNKEKFKTWWAKWTQDIFGSTVTSSFVSALAIGIFTIIITRTDILEIISGQESKILIAVIVPMMYGLFSIGPAVIVGSKHGSKAGVQTFMNTILWLMLGVILVSIAQNDHTISEFLDE